MSERSPYIEADLATRYRCCGRQEIGDCALQRSGALEDKAIDGCTMGRELDDPDFGDKSSVLSADGRHVGVRIVGNATDPSRQPRTRAAGRPVNRPGHPRGQLAVLKDGRGPENNRCMVQT